MDALYADWRRLKQHCDSSSESPVQKVAGFVQRLYNPQCSKMSCYGQSKRASKHEQRVLDDISKLEEYFRNYEEHTGKLQRRGKGKPGRGWQMVDDQLSSSSVLPSSDSSSSSGGLSSSFFNSSKGSDSVTSSAAAPAVFERMVEDAGESTSSRVSRAGNPTDPQDALEQVELKQDEQQKQKKQTENSESNSAAGSSIGSSDSVASILSAIISEVELHQVLLDSIDESFMSTVPEMVVDSLPAASSSSDLVDDKKKEQDDLQLQVVELQAEVVQLKLELNVHEMKSLARKYGLVALLQGIVLCSTFIPLISKFMGTHDFVSPCT